MQTLGSLRFENCFCGWGNLGLGWGLTTSGFFATWGLGFGV